MKILHINSYYVTNDMYTQMYDRQVKAGHDIFVYLPSPKGTSITRPDYAHVQITHGKYDRIIFHLKHKKIVKDAKKRFCDGGYDIVHAHSLFTNGSVALQLKKEFGYPYMAAVRSTDLYTFFKYMPHLRPLGLEILKNAERVIIIADAMKRELFNKYIPEHMKEEIEKKTVIIPNGIHEFWRENLCAEPKKAPRDKKLKIVTASTISNNKNQLTVCKALAKMVNKGYDIEYHVVGKVVEKRVFNAVMKYPFVKYHSHMTREGLKELYADMDIFVLISHVETFGLVCAEAMSQGLPVIYTKDQGFDGWFEEGRIGYAVPATDEDGLVCAIEKTLSNYERMSSECPKCASQFSWDVFVKQYDDVMAECIKKN